MGHVMTMNEGKVKESRNRAKEKYYSETRFRSAHHRFSLNEDELILGKRMPDKELADLLKVSIKSIHNRRARLKQIEKYGAEIW